MENFKVGDWVKQVKENYSNYNKCFKIKAVLNDNLYIVESNIFDIDTIQNTDSQFELWEPKQGEWCWFWNGDKQPFLAQMDFLENDEDCINYWTKQGIHGSYADLSDATHCFQYCEPFIGELPIIYKVFVMAEFLTPEEIDALLDIAEQCEDITPRKEVKEVKEFKELKSLKVLRLLKDYPIFAENKMLLDECIKELEEL